MAELFSGPSSALCQKSHIGTMRPMARLEDELKSGAILGGSI